MYRPPSRPKTAPANVNGHRFRERDKTKERQISSREFGVHYETEKQRVLRREAELHGLMLERDAWPPNQHAPLHLTPRDTRCNTTLKTRDTKLKPVVDTIGEYWVSEIRLPYSPGYPELRPKPNTTGLGTPREAFCAVKQGRFLVKESPRPIFVQEPWADRAHAEWWKDQR
ncbi:unnamed protein product [Durusdinium trenchii]|uniref:Uncharacterized protein n=1 Tax=Durusdinium trenchii TaxID=1381693 RepID=A0ABP0NHW1_9DINO